MIFESTTENSLLRSIHIATRECAPLLSTCARMGPCPLLNVRRGGYYSLNFTRGGWFHLRHEYTVWRTQALPRARHFIMLDGHGAQKWQ